MCIYYNILLKLIKSDDKGMKRAKERLTAHWFFYEIAT